MFSWIRVSSFAVLFCAALVLPLQAQRSDRLQVGTPPLHRVEPPAPGARPEDLEKRGDELKESKNFLDAVDYYQAALKGAPANAAVLNKLGICQLMMQRYKEARKSFEHSMKADRSFADAYNNLGVVFYATQNFGGAIKNYQ